MVGHSASGYLEHYYQIVACRVKDLQHQLGRLLDGFIFRKDHGEVT